PGSTTTVCSGSATVFPHLDLAIGPFLAVVGAVVPDLDPSGAVLARPGSPRRTWRSRAGGPRSVSRGDRPRIGRQPFGQRPGRQHPAAFEQRIPVQPPRVVLVDDEQVIAAPGHRPLGGHRLGGARRGALPLVGRRFIAHSSVVRRFRRHLISSLRAGAPGLLVTVPSRVPPSGSSALPTQCPPIATTPSPEAGPTRWSARTSVAMRGRTN
ncbi:MAG: hypothetical protein JWR81_750, partial [Pseudonocardia sp.]|nr:hypothetical protein [Pseudonocardia sp.]